jgi:CheY-like chemotaxis protein
LPRKIKKSQEQIKQIEAINNSDEEFNNDFVEKNVKILVVEDEDDMRELISDTLSENYDVVSANTAEQAILLLQEVDFQLIVSDVMLGAMNGFELCKKVKNDINTSHIKFILLTALSEKDYNLN